MSRSEKGVRFLFHHPLLVPLVYDLFLKLKLGYQLETSDPSSSKLVLQELQAARMGLLDQTGILMAVEQGLSTAELFFLLIFRLLRAKQDCM